MKHISGPQLQAVRSLCKRHRVAQLFAFGSVLTPRFGPGSDIDFLVEFEAMPPEDYVDHYMDLSSGLELLLHRKIDLVTVKSLKNPYFVEEVLKTRLLVYPNQKQRG